jgi:hypothetical protein
VEPKLLQGVEVDYAGQRWRVYRALGPDAILLKNAAGVIVPADRARIASGAALTITLPRLLSDE